MKIIKQNFIFNVNAQYSWAQKRAVTPTVDVLNDKVWRIYYSTRDSNNQSRISYIEVEAGKPENILYIHDNYLFDIGELGLFDDSGITVSSILTYDNKKYLYYLGWSKRATTPYHNSMGLAISYDNGKTFKKFSKGPLLSPNHKEPYSNGATFTLYDERCKIFRLYYVSFTGWVNNGDILDPLYDIKYAESTDGIDWKREQKISIPMTDNEVVGRPCVLIDKVSGVYKMWYARRKIKDFRDNNLNSYKIGYAESNDGINFTIMDNKLSFNTTAQWDSIMQTYPYVIEYQDKYWMFYNGNGFGESGFGYAVFEK